MKRNYKNLTYYALEIIRRQKNISIFKNFFQIGKKIN
jgi:hypothetical protein